jgi:hypothetical protein
LLFQRIVIAPVRVENREATEQVEFRQGGCHLGFPRTESFLTQIFLCKFRKHQTTQDEQSTFVRRLFQKVQV